jgi:metal-dependent amidase/aminoacylase/carboxypeptidase family protein
VVRQRASAVQEKVINWRRDIHEHPELADRRRGPRAWLPSTCGAWG